MKTPLMILLLLNIFLNTAFAETIVINGEDDWAPYSAATKDYKNVEGLAPDIVRAAFKSQGVTAITRPVPFARCMLEVDNGTAIGCFDTIINQNTKDNYIFHKTPMFQAEMVVYGKFDDPKSNIQIKDLEGKTVGTAEGYTYPAEFVANKKIVMADGPTERSALERLAAGRVQYAVMWGLTGENIIQKNPHLAKKVKALGTISRDSLFINFSKKHKDGAKYAAVFEKGLQEIIQNGTYKRLEDSFHKKHLSFKEWIPRREETH